ncbi:universal stress protein [Haloplanus salinarum]|jgi:nucleotide-binding universal stress UspA family protein|uniref:universal stress protein n=1 Tax=Haloplanus salinarum TaxID=1912324 RepID=UPI00214CC9B5|nr:universal stress protein [Haloplanus salinarum]
MTLLVPFDDSALAAAALKRACEFGACRDEAVVALTVVPDDRSFAEERGWIGADEAYRPDDLCRQFERRVKAVDDAVTFRCERPGESEDATATTTDDVTRTVREVAAELDVSVLFVGSENAGRVSSPLTSVGDPLSSDARYDVHIVRHAE